LARDRHGVKAMMGHTPASGDMSAVYRPSFDDERLRSVADHVHAWLYAKADQDKKAGKCRQSRREASVLTGAWGFLWSVNRQQHCTTIHENYRLTDKC
jgi:hypothetical protein